MLIVGAFAGSRDAVQAVLCSTCLFMCGATFVDRANFRAYSGEPRKNIVADSFFSFRIVSCRECLCVSVTCIRVRRA